MPHIIGIAWRALAVTTIYLLCQGLGWTMVFWKQGEPLAMVGAWIAVLLATPFLWIAPDSFLDQPYLVLALIALFWGTIWYGFSRWQQRARSS